MKNAQQAAILQLVVKQKQNKHVACFRRFLKHVSTYPVMKCLQVYM